MIRGNGSKKMMKIMKQVNESQLTKGLNLVAYFAIALGIFVRLRLYFSNRSLWHDEVSLALNLVERSYQELLQPLDYNQAAPPGFLWIEKLAIQVFGNHEYALRLFPLTSGIIAIFLFYQLAYQYSSKFVAPIAITLFACLRFTVYYSVEVKQYSSDLMFGLLLFVILSPLRNQHLSKPTIIFVSLLGALCIWFSHPSIFILAAVELTTFVTTPLKKWHQIIRNRFPIYVTWLISFTFLYLVTIVPTLQNQDLVSAWATRYPDSLLDLWWGLDALGRFFYKPLGFYGIRDGIAIFAFLIGCVACYRQNPIKLWQLNAPLLITLFASYLHQYPFRNRLILFLVPFATLILVEGVVYLINQFQNNRRIYKLWGTLGLIILLVLLVPFFVRSSKRSIAPQLAYFEEARPIIEYVKEHHQPHDSIYVYDEGKKLFKYYAKRYNLVGENANIGSVSIRNDDDKIIPKRWELLKQELKQLDNQKRVWVILIHFHDHEKKFLVSHLNAMGQPLQCLAKPRAYTCLYNFQQEKKKTPSD